MRRALLIFAALIPAYATLTFAAFEKSALSGRADSPQFAAMADRRVAAAADKDGLPPVCKASLTRWTQAKLKERIAADLPTAELFGGRANAELEDYAQASCPFGAFLIAVSAANEIGTGARRRASLEP